MPPTSLSGHAELDPDASLGWIRRFLPVLARQRRLIALTLALSLTWQLAGLATPLILKVAIDDALTPPTTRALTPLVVALGILGGGRLLVGMIQRYALFATAANVQYDLRTLLQRHLGQQSFSFHDEVETGQLISRANSDIRVIQMFLVFGPTLAMTYLAFLAALGVMLWTHAGLTLVVLSAAPLMIFSGVKMRQRTFPLAWLTQARTADVATVAEENISGAHVVRAMAAEISQIRRLDLAAERLRWAAEREITVRARYQPLMESLPRLANALFVLIGGWLAVSERVSIGTIVLFVGYLAMAQFPLRMAGFAIVMGQQARAAANRVFEVIDRPVDIRDAPDAVPLGDVEGLVELTDVTFGYGDDETILRGIDLRIEPGETVALVGRTASGKSTLASLLPRFYDVTGGAVTIDGIDVRTVTLASLRATVGLVMDEAFLFTASVRDNVAYARPDATEEELVAAAEAAGALAFIRDLPDGWDTVVGERGHTLSGGQRQRITIARALVQNPRILVLDDATSAVDVQVEREIHAALEALLSSRTTLLIAHRPATIALADRVAFLDGGRIVATGTHQQLLATLPAYAEVLAQSERRAPAAAPGGPTPGDPGLLQPLAAAPGLTAMSGVLPRMPS